MAADYVIKANSVPGPLVFNLSYSDKSTPDVSGVGTTATFRMRPRGVDPSIILGTCVVLDSDTVTYQFGPSELTGLSGVYEGEVVVEWASGRKETFPADAERPYFIILVEPQIQEAP